MMRLNFLCQKSKMEKSILKNKVKYAISNLEKLKSFSKVKEEVYIEASQRVCEKIIETTIKINIILLKEKNVFPNTYKKSFTEMKVFKIFENEDLEEISKTAVFRNKLAHEYIDMSNYYYELNCEKILELYPKYLKIIYSLIK